MQIIPRNKEELKEAVRPYTDNHKILTDFLNSNYYCVELKGYTHRDAISCQSSMCASIRYYRMAGVRVRIRGDRVFLVKEEQTRNKKK